MTSHASVSREEVLTHLAAIAGPDHAQLGAGAIRVAPGDTQQISSILRFASQNALTVVPTGSGTKLAWGNPVAPDILLSLERLNAVTEHAWPDLTCTVQAGCTWASMQRELAHHGQMVALDPLWPDRATVGGVISTNDSGALRLRYGGLRDLVIGMTIVLADGAIAKSGGKVVKNVAGYDLHKLLTGSHGTLGVVTQVNFRLHPVEQHPRTFTISSQYAAQLAKPLADLMHAQIAPSAVQLCTAAGFCALHVRLCARPECIREHEAQLRRIFDNHSFAEGSESVWQAREHLFAAADAAVIKASMLPADLCPTVDAVRESSVAASVDLSVVAQATGLATIALNGDPDAILSVIEQLRARLHSSGGSAVLLRLPAVLRNKLDIWDCRSDALPLMREIKRRFDPIRTLNPGRFVGGI
jgi:glycolate dehydrogenase FAD-binding subunit